MPKIVVTQEDIKNAGDLKDKKTKPGKDAIKEPYPKYLDDLATLALEVNKATYNFEEEETELDKMSYHLMSHPEEDLLSFNILYAKTQGYLTRANSILIQVLRTKRQWMKYKRDAKKIYRRAFSILLQEEDIKKLRNQEMRSFIIEDRIRPLMDIKTIVDGVIEDLDSIVEIIKVRTEDLGKANVNLRSQQEITLFLPVINYPIQAKKTD